MTLEQIISEAQSGNTKPYIETFLSVKSKADGIVPFKLNRAQIKYLAQKSFRNVVLKARQMGISTIVLADFYVRTIVNEGVTTLLVAQKRDQAKVFLDTIKMFYELTPAEVRPIVENDSMSEFSFPNLRSKILIASPTKDAGRGLTINNLLCSELATWKYPVESMTGLEEAVPEGGTIVVESTPNGNGNHYHVMWKQAQDAEDPAYNGYTPILLEASLMYSEEWLKAKRRSVGPRRFAQEYGLDFLQAGRPVFSDAYLKKHRDRINSGEIKPKEPVCATCAEVHVTEPPANHLFFSRHYLHGIDVAEGTNKGDFTVHAVFDRDTGEEVFCQRGRWPIDAASSKVHEVAKKYPGIVGVERNNHGHAMLLRLRQLGTPGIYRHDDGKDGWLTSSRTKTVMIDDFEEAVRNEVVKVGDLQALDEMRDYQYNDNGSTSAPAGSHDDHVMARAIAWQMRKRSSRPLFLTD